ncbi:MAG: penicillin-binding protein 1C [Methyloprofundus sp.]|nr:penicillin-binding protein 1C [Methyloprofundus sp.]
MITQRFLCIAIIIALLLVLSGVGLNRLYPLPINSKAQNYARTIVSQEGEVLRAFADKQGVWRYPVSIDQVSPKYLQALLGYEDRWFYWHFGVNPFAILRASLQNLRAGRVISGGSTLTMQVARLIDPHQRSIQGKLKQVFRALQLEWYFSKQEILTYYLNQAPFGGVLEGVQVASYRYLGKSAKQLSDAEAALLAILPQAPSRLRPDRHAKRAEQARNKVLDRLANLGIWTTEQVQDAKLETVLAQWHRAEVLAPLLARRLKPKVSANQPLITTLDYAMQQRLEEQVKLYVQGLAAKTSAAVLVVENKTMQVKTYIGSSDFTDLKRYGHLDMVRAIRSPGSSLKPFLYALAMDAGLIHSESLLQDAPLSFGNYRPSNFNRGFSGAVSVNVALRQSLNIPAVQVLQHLGVNNFLGQLKNAGLTVSLPAGAKANLSVILGGVGTNLESLVEIYSALANQGQSGKLRYLAEQPLEQKRFLSAGSAFIIKKILQRDLSGKASKANPIAWKTGTSYGHRDMWSVGVNDQYTVGVWIGRPDGSPLPGYYGARTAAPLLFALMHRIQNNKISSIAVKKQPASVTEEMICWPLGGLQKNTPEAQCHRLKKAWILEQNSPQTLVSEQQWESNPLTILLNQKTGLRLNASCLSETARREQKALWPLAVEPWVEPALRRKAQIPVYAKECQLDTQQHEKNFVIEGLQDHSILQSAGGHFSLPIISLKTTGGQGQQFWYVNGQAIETTGLGQNMHYRFRRTGKYQLMVIDSIGQTAMLNVEVQ